MVCRKQFELSQDVELKSSRVAARLFCGDYEAQRKHMLKIKIQWEVLIPIHMGQMSCLFLELRQRDMILKVFIFPALHYFNHM